MNITMKFQAKLASNPRLEGREIKHCIYCSASGPFNAEHVFPAGLGGDDRAFMLRDMVCETCNSAFSRIEAGLMRNSPEAFARIHSQTRSRNRGNASTGPKFQPESITTFLPEGGDAEVELRAGGQVVLLPQFSLRDKQVQGQGSDASELRAFAASLQAVLGEETLLLVTKRPHADGTDYVVLRYEWDGLCYREAGASISRKPPKACIWKDQRPNDAVPDRPHRIYCRSGGQLVLRAGDKDTDCQFLTILRKNLSQIVGAANKAGPSKPIHGAPIMVQMSASFIDRERVLAKIGLNFCAHAVGESFVRQSCFDEIKSSILTAAPAIKSNDILLHELTTENTIAKIFSAAPEKHHIGMLTAVPLPSGGVAVCFAIRLYGGAVTNITLTESATLPIPNTPVFLLVDYLNHKMSILNLGDFTVKYLMPAFAP